MSRTGRARSLSSPGQDPCPGAALGPGGSRWSSAPHAPGRDEEAPGRPWGGTRPGPVRAGRAGGRRPPVTPVPLFLFVPSVPGRAERRRGRGLFPNRKGLGNPLGGQLEKSTESVLPAAAPRGCRCHPLPTAPQTPRPGVGGGPVRRGDARRFFPLRLARGPARDEFCPASLTSRLPLCRGQSPDDGVLQTPTVT